MEEEAEEEELADATPFQEQEGLAQGVLQHPLLADLDEGQEQFRFAPIWIRHQFSKVQLDLAVDVADLVVIGHYRVVQLVHVAGDHFRSTAHDEGQRGDAAIRSSGYISAVGWKEESGEEDGVNYYATELDCNIKFCFFFFGSSIIEVGNHPPMSIFTQLLYSLSAARCSGVYP